MIDDKNYLQDKNCGYDVVDKLNGLQSAEKYNSVFTGMVENAKIEIAKSVTADKGKTVKKMEDAVSGAVVGSAELEKQRVDYESQILALQQELVDTQRKINDYEQRQTKYDKKTAQRKYHFEGLKSIVGGVIKEATNIYLLYFVTAIILPFRLIGMLWTSTVGNALSGLDPTDRKKKIIAFLWTFLAFCIVIFVVMVVLWILRAVAIIK